MLELVTKIRKNQPTQLSIEINNPKDVDKGKELNSYLCNFLKYLEEKNELSLCDALKNATFSFNSYKWTYSNRWNQRESCFFNDKKTKMYRLKNTNSSSVIISFPCADSRTKLLDLVMKITSNPEIDIDNITNQFSLYEEEKSKRTSFKWIEVSPDMEELLTWTVGSISNVVSNQASTENSQTLNSSNLSNVLELVSTQESTETLLQVNESTKDDISKTIVTPEVQDMAITDELLNNLLYLFIEDKKTELVDEKENLYFIPESSIDAILRDGAVYNLNTKFITESVIKMNLPIALWRKKWYAKVVIRIDSSLLEQKEDTLSVSIKDQLELLMVGMLKRQTQKWVDVVFVPHNLDDIKVAIQTTVTEDFDESLRTFYSRANQWLSLKRPLVRKWFLIKIPSDFDKNSYNHPRLLAMNWTEIKKIIANLSNQINAWESTIQELEETIKELESQIELKKEKIYQLDIDNKQKSNQLQHDLEQTINALNQQITGILPTVCIDKVIEEIQSRIDFLLVTQKQLVSRKQEFYDAGDVSHQITELKDYIEKLEFQKVEIEQTIEKTDEQISIYKIELQSYEKEKQRRLDLLKKQIEELD